jgi:hypothetical protein
MASPLFQGYNSNDLVRQGYQSAPAAGVLAGCIVSEGLGTGWSYIIGGYTPGVPIPTPNLDAFIMSVRELVGDGPTDNLSRNENLDNSDLGHIVDGSNRRFGVLSFPIAPDGVVVVVQDGSPTLDYNVYEDTGVIVTWVPPAATLYASYYYYLLPDTTWIPFVIKAMEKLNVATVDGPEVDLPNVPQGLLAALKSYTAASWCMRIASQTGLWYNQRLQERDEQRENISKKFSDMATVWTKLGDAERDSFYMGAGTQLRPNFRIVQMTPRNYTPSR